MTRGTCGLRGHGGIVHCQAFFGPPPENRTDAFAVITSDSPFAKTAQWPLANVYEVERADALPLSMTSVVGPQFTEASEGQGHFEEMFGG